MTGKKILELRQEKDWSTRELAERAGIAQTMVVRYENSKAIPTNTVLKKLAKALGVTTEEIKEGKTSGLKGISSTDYKLRLNEALSLRSEEAQTTVANVIASFLELEKLQGSIDELARKVKM